ncbi:PAS domain S-box protein [Ancylobacter lacus]|uniref:PAS domain S-box protein n=1 Tax=Ancylobacter lacus TaxID=2579970 RepID=UPI001BCFB734|nr:PAS domain S-box protein [Ancylobacter lacus]MBS7539582.1 PAS domain S-box protein [Ancylobacter lacus]
MSRLPPESPTVSRRLDGTEGWQSGLGWDGEMERLIRGHDWSGSPLGLRERWSTALEQAVRLILPARAQIVLFWGPDFCALYNDAYRPTIGDKHPRAFGRPAREGWAELWDDLHPLLAHVRDTGETLYAKDRRFYIERHGFGEDVFFDISYSAVTDDDGSVGGVLCLVNETTERIRAEIAMKDSAERLRLATQSAAIGTWDYDPLDGTLLWDDQCRRLFGLAPEAPVTFEGSFKAGLHPDDLAPTLAAVEAAMDPAGSGRFAVEYRTVGLSDGVERWVAATGKALFAGGRAVRFIGTARDISRDKAAEAALSASSRALREETHALEILNVTAMQVAAELDLDRLVSTVVAADAALTGAEFGSFLHNPGDGLAHGCGGAGVSDFPSPLGPALLAATFQGRGPLRCEDLTLDPRVADGDPAARGGGDAVRSYLAVPVISRSGEVMGGLFFGHSLPGIFTERAERLTRGLAAQAAIGIDNARLFQAQQRLNRSLEEQVAARTLERDRIWTLSRDPFVVVDGDGRWVSASPAWTDLLGWSLEELTGRGPSWMEHPDDIGRAEAEIARLAAGDTLTRVETRFRDRQGRYRWFSWSAAPQGDLIYCVARDVTLEREAAEALRQAEETLRHAQKMETVGQLTGGIAHDFNNLLQIVTGNLEIIARNLPEEPARLRRSLDNAMTGARRAATLTQRLLAFARQQPLAPKKVDANRLVAGMSELLHRTLGETIEIETVQASGLWPVEADPNQLENAILNLAINARDAMPEGGKLTIETSNAMIDGAYAGRHPEVPQGQYVVVCVSDTGSGMDEATLNRAFEPFFTTKEVGRGTGLGLSMVYGFVKQSGGHVKIYSEPGHGSTVKIYLPRFVGPGTAEEDEPAGIPAPEASRDETILVCEDDAGVRSYSLEVLRELGYRVLEAEDGAAALRLLDRTGRIDLLFTDVVLPGGMTGADLAERARKMRPGLKVLFTTGYARNAIVHHGRLDPGVELITKPFGYADLAARVRDLLDGLAGAAPAREE